MVSMSRFTHSYDLDGAVALYHSLRMKPVYLSKNAFGSLQAWLASSFCDKIENAPEEIKAEVQELAKYKISHNDIGEIDRGVWRKYNPYNPYVEEKDDNKAVDNLNIESLDDLFDDIDNKKDDAPILPQYDNNEDDGYDLQKELEAKFDELFGPLDDDE